MITRLARLAAFQNPEFYRAQAMRLPTYDKPRIICCASLEPKYVVLPRGCVDEAVELLESNQIRAEFEDHREQGTEVPVRFLGMLREEQRRAVEALRAHDFGVLAATTAFGKTVVAAALIAERGRSTMILVHRRELLGQWTERLKQFCLSGRMIWASLAAAGASRQVALTWQSFKAWCAKVKSQISSQAMDS